jgi:hypothetical protein
MEGNIKTDPKEIRLGSGTSNSPARSRSSKLLLVLVRRVRSNTVFVFGNGSLHFDERRCLSFRVCAIFVAP